MTILPPLPFSVDIAPDAEPDADPGTWAWVDVSSYRRQAGDIELHVGRDDESSTVEAGDSSLGFDLRDGYLSPRNPYSPLYRRIGTNTPIRYRFPRVTDTFARTSGSGWGTADSGQAWTTLFPASWTVSSGGGKVALAAAGTATEAFMAEPIALDVDLIYSVSLSAVTTAQPWVSAVEVRRVDASNTYRVHTEFKPSGVVTTKIVRVLEGAAVDLVSSVTVSATYSAGSKLWTHVQTDGGAIRAKVWSGLITAEPATWDVSVVDGKVDGAQIGFYQWRLSGNTNAGTLTATIDDLTVQAILWNGNVPEWPPRWDKSGNDSTMPIAAAGPLRRLGAGDDPIRSPLARQLPRYGPGGYWPFEDEAGAERAASGIPGGRSAQVRDVTFAADSDALPGALSMTKIDATTFKANGGPTGPRPTDWAFVMFWVLPAKPAPSADYQLFELRGEGTVVRWQVVFNDLGFRLFGWDFDGTKIINTIISTYQIDPTRAFSIQLEAKQSGGNVAWALIWNQVGEDVNWAASGTVSGTAGKLRLWTMSGSTPLVDALFGHIWMGPESLPYVDPTFLLVSDGYRGELAGDRIARLCAEEGVRIAVSDGTSEPLGRQSSDTFLNLLREAAEADPGVLYERGTGLGYLTRAGRYHVPVTLTLDWEDGDLAEAPEPTDDDQRLRNYWTIKRKDGASATYEDDDSIARHGKIKDSAEINIQRDSRLLSWAAWQTNLSTYDDLRWPTVVINLIDNPELIPQFLACRVGSRIVINNPKDQVPGIAIDLVIEGIKMTMGRHCWLVEFACSPARPWDVGVYDDPSHRYKYDAATTTLASARNSSQTSWPITTVKVTEAWSTTGVPYQWESGGEVVTVTAITAAAGTGPYTQTATVTRGVNGVFVDHDAGDRAHLARPAIWGL